MNIVKELNKVAARNARHELDEANKILDSVKAHLTEESKADSDMLQYFGTAKAVKQQSDLKVDLTGRLNGEILTSEDIKDICIKYALRCLKAQYYVKEIPAKALNDLRIYKENIKDTFDHSKLYVIAPSSHFELGPRPKKDPVLIYWTDNGGEVISQWGSDFNFTRRIYGFLNGKFLYFIFIFLFIAGFSAVGLGINETAEDRTIITTIALALSVAVLFCFGLYLLIEERIETHHSRWNKSTK